MSPDCNLKCTLELDTAAAEAKIDRLTRAAKALRTTIEFEDVYLYACTLIVAFILGIIFARIF